MAKLKLRKGDNVLITTGKYKNKTGVITIVFPEMNRAIVQGINMVKKHLKPSASNPQGSIQEKESSIHISNLALFTKSGDKNIPSKVMFKKIDGSKVRVLKKTGETV